MLWGWGRGGGGPLTGAWEAALVNTLSPGDRVGWRGGGGGGGGGCAGGVGGAGGGGGGGGGGGVPLLAPGSQPFICCS